jgi:hypothetical protein
MSRPYFSDKSHIEYEHDVRIAGHLLRQIRAEIDEVAHKLFHDPAYCRTRDDRERLAQELNTLNVKLMSVLIQLGQDEESAE